jgi:hypothetical protein
MAKFMSLFTASRVAADLLDEARSKDLQATHTDFYRAWSSSGPGTPFPLTTIPRARVPSRSGNSPTPRSGASSRWSSPGLPIPRERPRIASQKCLARSRSGEL